MAAQTTIHYELSSTGDLERLRAELNEIEAGLIVVAFHESRDWAVNDFQLARLVAAARNSGKRLVAEGGSGSLADRAVKFGFTNSAVVTDAPSLNDQETTALNSGSEDPTASISPPDRFDSTADLATYRPESLDVPITWRGESDNNSAPTFEESDQGLSASDPERPTDEKPTADEYQPVGRAQASEKPSNAHAAPIPNDRRLRAPVALGRATPTQSSKPNEESAPTSTAPKRRASKVKLAAAFIIPLLVIVVIGALSAYMLPTATIEIVPQEETISSSLTYGVAATNAVLDVTIDPSSLSSTSTAEATREASGERFEAVGTAGGTIQLTNPLTSEVTIAAGTELPGSNGVLYYTAEALTVPAADPFGSMSFGSAAVGVYAGINGPDGNLDAGGLTGQMGNETFYTNPSAISGGRLDRFPVITEDDVAAVQEDVSNQLQEIAEDEFLRQVPAGLEIVPGTLEIGQPEIEVSAEPGVDGESVSATGTISVKALAFDPDELHELAGKEADRLLARQGGSDRILLAETVAIQGPTDLDGETPAFKIDVNATARKFITEAEKEAIIDSVAGKSLEEAGAILAEHPKIEGFQIDLEQSWLMERIPEITSRISINVSSGERTASTR